MQLCDKLREEKSCIDRCADEDQPDRPIRHFEKWKNLRRYLHPQPCDDCVGDCDFINIAPLELSEEVLWIHSARLDEALVTGAL